MSFHRFWSIVVEITTTGFSGQRVRIPDVFWVLLIALYVVLYSLVAPLYASGGVMVTAIVLALLPEGSKS
ncbi:hypothetical protein K469DRAFT_707109 [Zopfia rhizophila CBS 207.26]|uniref:Amino acid permease/ SLC12A domain-containing protein n=1 Tax=Zopfia rhizophila CBS 207.26 TaxID=1314779 RepID=A0A6A6D566_9PEZI|nr:hypothetical protein K469DRAFT_707109 [Zopfia rhizophila CBS 207.26]